METKLDLYFLATQGQWSDKHDFPVAPHGFYIYVEEEIITVRGGGGLGSGVLQRDDWIKKKKIKLTITHENVVYTKEVIIDNINLSVSSTVLSTKDKSIELSLYDVTLSDKDVVEKIKVDVSDINF